MGKGTKIALGLTASIGAILAGYGFYRALLKPPPLLPSEFTVSDLVISPSQVYPGELVTTSVTVTNIGETKGTATVTCEVT